MFKGEGEPGKGGAPAGDLHVIVRVAEHATFRRDGLDVHSDVHDHVRAGGARRGDRSADARRRGQDARSPRARSRAACSGSAAAASRRRRARTRRAAITWCTSQVEVPTELTPRQRELIEELARASGEQRGHAARRRSGCSTGCGRCSTNESRRSSRAGRVACAAVIGAPQVRLARARIARRAERDTPRDRPVHAGRQVERRDARRRRRSTTLDEADRARRARHSSAIARRPRAWRCARRGSRTIAATTPTRARSLARARDRGRRARASHAAARRARRRARRAAGRSGGDRRAAAAVGPLRRDRRRAAHRDRARARAMARSWLFLDTRGEPDGARAAVDAAVARGAVGDPRPGRRARGDRRGARGRAARASRSPCSRPTTAPIRAPACSASSARPPTRAARSRARRRPTASRPSPCSRRATTSAPRRPTRSSPRRKRLGLAGHRAGHLRPDRRRPRARRQAVPRPRAGARTRGSPSTSRSEREARLADVLARHPVLAALHPRPLRPRRDRRGVPAVLQRRAAHDRVPRPGDARAQARRAHAAGRAARRRRRLAPPEPADPRRRGGAGRADRRRVRRRARRRRRRRSSPPTSSSSTGRAPRPPPPRRTTPRRSSLAARAPPRRRRSARRARTALARGKLDDGACGAGRDRTSTARSRARRRSSRSQATS